MFVPDFAFGREREATGVWRCDVQKYRRNLSRTLAYTQEIFRVRIQFAFRSITVEVSI